MYNKQEPKNIFKKMSNHAACQVMAMGAMEENILL